MRLVKNEEKYYMDIAMLRTHPLNKQGFAEDCTITKEQQFEYMTKYKSNYYVCLHDEDVVVGFIGEVDNDIRLAVHPDYKNQGIGHFMLTEFMRLRPQSKAKILLDNIASIRLFKSCGFSETGRDDKFVYMSLTYNKPKANPYKIVRDFEEEVAAYTGSPYAVSVDSCTNALFLCCVYLKVKEVTIPSKTYLSVPQSIIHAGGTPVFDASENDWKGIYQLKPYPIIDAAKRFTSNMYIPGMFMCLSFHIKKHLKIGKGGMILTDNADAVDWFKKARYEGRSEKLYHSDDIDMLGWNMYMTPQQAAHGLALMQNIPIVQDDLEENNGYRDLREFTIFKDGNYRKH